MADKPKQPTRAKNRTLALNGEACVRARRALGLSREALSARAVGPHPLSPATLKRAEAGTPVYLATARRLAELLDTPLSLLSSSAGRNTAPQHLDTAPAALSVMPFRWLGPAESGAYLATGLTEDLLARLARFWFPVVSPLAARVDAPLPPAAEIAATLGIRYWVEGSVQRSGRAVRVIARLVEADGGRILWTQTYDRTLGEVLRFQEELAARIVCEVGLHVLDAEASRAGRTMTPDPSAWELSIMGAWHFQRQSRAANVQARELLSQALERDKNLPLAWYTLAMTHRLDLINGWSASPIDSFTALQQTGVRFAEHHPNDAGHHIVAAYVDVIAGARDSARPRLDTAIDIDPSHATAYSVLGQTLAFGGDGDTAVEQFEMALRLRPVSIENWQPIIGLALAHFVAGRYEDTLRYSKQAIAMRPEMMIPLGTLAVACSCLNDTQGAAVALDRLRAIDPAIDVSNFRALGHSAAPEVAGRFFEALRRAGLPG